MRATIVIATLVAGFAGGAHSQTDNWTQLAKSSDGAQTYYGLKGSYKLGTNNSGEAIVQWTEKVDDAITQKITLERLYIRTADCERRQGKSVVVDMDGKFLYDVDFIFGAGSVGSALAETLCGIYLNNQKKGL